MDMETILTSFIECIDDKTNFIYNLLKGRRVFKYALINKLYRCIEMAPKIPQIEQWLINFDNYNFFKLFRLDKKSFEKLFNLIQKNNHLNIEKKYNGGHYPINLKSQLLVFLWYMATMDTLITISTIFKICPTSVMCYEYCE